jgi:hypothetical protein
MIGPRDSTMTTTLLTVRIEIANLNSLTFPIMPFNRHINVVHIDPLSQLLNIWFPDKTVFWSFFQITRIVRLGKFPLYSNRWSKFAKNRLVYGFRITRTWQIIRLLRKAEAKQNQRLHKPMIQQFLLQPVPHVRNFPFMYRTGIMNFCDLANLFLWDNS